LVASALPVRSNVKGRSCSAQIREIVRPERPSSTAIALLLRPFDVESRYAAAVGVGDTLTPPCHH
jgi:hypothetical protein